MALVIDAYRGHHTPRVQHKAERLAIEITPLPRGLTAGSQPLDRTCFGLLKRISERLWEEKTHTQPEIIPKHKEGAKPLEEMWGQLTREAVQHGWPSCKRMLSSKSPNPQENQKIHQEVMKILTGRSTS
jgi:hypothetical protein